MVYIRRPLVFSPPSEFYRVKPSFRVPLVCWNYPRVTYPVTLSPFRHMKVTAIYNSRYEEFFQNQFYFVGFLLDPRMLSQVFKITSILICRYFGTLTRL